MYDPASDAGGGCWVGPGCPGIKRKEIFRNMVMGLFDPVSDAGGGCWLEPVGMVSDTN